MSGWLILLALVFKRVVLPTGYNQKLCGCAACWGWVQRMTYGSAWCRAASGGGIAPVYRERGTHVWIKARVQRGAAHRRSPPACGRAHVHASSGKAASINAATLPPSSSLPATKRMFVPCDKHHQHHQQVRTSTWSTTNKEHRHRLSCAGCSAVD